MRRFETLRAAVALVIAGAAQAQNPPAATRPAVFDLGQIRREVLAYCESMRDGGGPYGCYRMGPGKRTDLYASCDVALIRAIMGENLKTTLSDAERTAWINHINSYQDAKDGHYEDTYGHHKLHANGMVIGALGVLGGKQKYPVRLYEPFDTPDEVIQWLDHEVNWRSQWSGSHMFWGGMHCFSLSQACTEDWRTRAFAWLDANLDEQTGWWRKGVPHADRHQPLGGSVHIIPIYQHHHHRFPYPERVIDSVLSLQLPNGRWLKTTVTNPMNYLELDALYALRYMQSLAPDYRKDDVIASVQRYSELVRGWWPEGKAALFKAHPHIVLAAVGTFGLLQQHRPDVYRDDRQWTDIFSDRSLYETAKVEVLP